MFYPAGWHDVVSLVMITAGLQPAAAINITNLVLITGIWSTGCLFMVSRITGERTMPLLVAAVVSLSYSSFPYLLLEFGRRLSVHALHRHAPGRPGRGVPAAPPGVHTRVSTEGNVLLLIGLLPGMALSHPATIMGLLALSVPPVVAAAYPALRATEQRRRLRAWVGSGAYLVVLVALWITLRPARSSSTNWDNMGNAAAALVDVVLNSPLDRPISILPTVLTIVGAAVVFNLRKNRFALGMYAVGAVLFVIGNWQAMPGLRWWVAGIWYNDFFRISAMLPVAGLLIASIGGVALAGTARSFFRGHRWPARDEAAGVDPPRRHRRARGAQPRGGTDVCGAARHLRGRRQVPVYGQIAVTHRR